MGRRLADLPEEVPADGGGAVTAAAGGVRNSGGDRSVAANGNGVAASTDGDGDKSTVRHMEGVTNGSSGGSGGGDGGGTGAKPSLSDPSGVGSGGDGEEGEVLLPSTSSSPRGGASDKDAAAANGGRRGSSHGSGSVDGGAGSGGGASATRSSSSPRREGRLPSPEGGGSGVEAGDAPNKPAGKDRWADSDSDEEEDGGGKAKVSSQMERTAQWVRVLMNFPARALFFVGGVLVFVEMLCRM